MSGSHSVRVPPSPNLPQNLAPGYEIAPCAVRPLRTDTPQVPWPGDGRYGGGELGRYGLGLKTASLSQCRRVTVVTRHIRQKENLDLRAVGAAVGAILSRVGPELLEEATKARQDRTVDVDTLEEAIEAGASGFARIRTGALGSDGEDRLAAHALSIRCLQRPDGGLAEADDGDDDGADLIAVVGRSY